MIFRDFNVGRYSCVLAVFAAACSASGPSAPSGSSGSAAPTGSIAAPLPVAPAANLIIRFQDQPATLIVRNAVVTRPGGTTYTFEVATDIGFAGNVQTKDGVAEGGGGTTGVRLDALAGGRDYYWHARAQGAGTTGVFGPASKFTVGPAIVINSPVPIAPLTGAQTATRPALRITNAIRSGPAGAITYKFEISTVATFASVLVTGSSFEGVNETDFVPTSDLPTATTLFWRATAIDAANGVTSTPSAVQSFTANPPSQAEVVAAQLGVPLWPGAVPPGSVGHATMGNDPAFGVGWDIKTLHYAPGNVDFVSPDIEMVRFFDLFDRGYDPNSAIAWMNQNGYPTQAYWYPPPEKAVLGLKYVYLASRGKVYINGIWDIVLRQE